MWEIPRLSAVAMVLLLNSENRLCIFCCCFVFWNLRSRIWVKKRAKSYNIIIWSSSLFLAKQRSHGKFVLHTLCPILGFLPLWYTRSNKYYVYNIYTLFFYTRRNTYYIYYIYTQTAWQTLIYNHQRKALLILNQYQVEYFPRHRYGKQLFQSNATPHIALGKIMPVVSQRSHQRTASLKTNGYIFTSCFQNLQ